MPKGTCMKLQQAPMTWVTHLSSWRLTDTLAVENEGNSPGQNHGTNCMFVYYNFYMVILLYTCHVCTYIYTQLILAPTMFTMASRSLHGMHVLCIYTKYWQVWYLVYTLYIVLGLNTLCRYMYGLASVSVVLLALASLMEWWMPTCIQRF